MSLDNKKANPARRTIVLVIAVVVGLGLILYVVTRIPSFTVAAKRKLEEKRPLPAVDTVDRVVADFSLFDLPTKKFREWRDFEIPAGDWSALWATLQPAMPDDDPANWQSLGRLEITTRTGPIHVDLYRLDESPGAFSIGPAYYRGGNSQELQRRLAEIVAKQ